MEISIKKLLPNSIFMNQVIEMGDKNRDTLGFFPKKAFLNQAEDGNIIIAVADDTCVGYLLFRKVKTQNRISITHLCVDKNFRNKEVGQRLVAHLINNTKEWGGIGLYCRRDYESNSFWEHIGFKFFHEKQGRGKDGAILTYFWYEQKGTSLFKYFEEKSIQSKPYLAIMDMNVLIKYYEDPNHPLRANYLLEDLTLAITPETRIEINRDENSNRRKEMLQNISLFPELTSDSNQVEQIYTILKSELSIILSDQTRSDLMQIAHAIASKANFFITNDLTIIRKLKDNVLTKFGLHIISIDDLIIYFDRLINNAAYETNRLAGSLITISRIESGMADDLAELFHRITNENKKAFREKLAKYLSDPANYETNIVYTQDHIPIGLFVIKRSFDERSFEIPLISIKKNQLSPALESQIIFWIVTQAISENKLIIKISDRNISSELFIALRDNSFIKFDNDWEKLNLVGIKTINEINEEIKETDFLGTNKIVAYVIDNFKNIENSQNESMNVSFEKLLWPVKVPYLDIPNYLVPIHADWAMDLFDYKLGNQTLFGSDPTRAFRMENVYYRSAHTKIPTPSSRILWYVSKDRYKKYQNVMAIRACSYVEDVIIGSPKTLFKKFEKLGVYNWENIRNTVEDVEKNEVLSFRFGRTELFKTPISLADYKKISGKNSAPQAPQKIENELFLLLYEKGMNRG